LAELIEQSDNYNYEKSEMVREAAKVNGRRMPESAYRPQPEYCVLGKMRALSYVKVHQLERFLACGWKEKFEDRADY
jgi:hypothetical protein